MSALSDTAQQALAALGRADLVGGIPSFNNAATIRQVVETAATGLARYFPDRRAVVLNSDGGSTDGTPDAVRAAARPRTVPVLSFPYVGPSGKGTALRAVFEAATRLGARACVVLDADLRSVTPEWIRQLAGPVLAGAADYVAPLYVRHKYDGTITNTLAYPLTRALYGVRVRQPIGGDFGLGAAVLATYLRQDVWHTDVARFGIDIWMTTTAIVEGYRVHEAALGAKIHDPKDPTANLGPMLEQVVGTLFALLARRFDRWWAVERSVPVPQHGTQAPVEPAPVTVNLAALIEGFREGAQAHGAVWRRLLASATYEAVMALAAQPPTPFTFPPALWARVVYDCAVAYCRQCETQTVLAALTPLYFGRTAGLVVDTMALDGAAFEAYLEQQAQAFELEKPYLRARWASITA